ncbi:hypothetical protein ACWXVL_01180 [Mycoplasma sp. 128]|uniref:hypothetical protein n=1 Tax=Mycoplasma sp. 3341 TaxID=3447506 RepID=UPI003F656D0F
MKKAKLLLSSLAALTTLVSVPLVTLSCINRPYQTNPKNDLSKSEVVWELQKNATENKNMYLDLSKYQKEAEQSNKNLPNDKKLKNVDFYSSHLKQYVTIPEISKYGKNYSYKWYVVDTADPFRAKLEIYYVPVEAIAVQDPSFIKAENEVNGDWSKMKNSSNRPLAKFVVELKFGKR